MADPLSPTFMCNVQRPTLNRTLTAAAALLLLPACSTPTDTGFNAPVTTPDYYSENHPFYLDDLPKDKQHTAPTRRLRHLYEFDYDADAQLPIDSQLAIKDGSPLGVIVSGVRIPEDLPGGRRDLAVILDVVTSTQSEPQSIVVFYQRDVPAGQMLNFENLLVYFHPEWDATTPPYFRLRIIDAYNERNSRIQSMLDRVGNLGAAVSGLMPHEIIPIVGVAQETAKLILANRTNRTLLDYQIQLYSTFQVAASGGADMGVLRAGAWVVLGRPRHDSRDWPLRPRAYAAPQSRRTSKPGCFPNNAPDPADFWREPLDIDRQTHQVLHVETGRPVYVPYVSIIVSSANAQIPKHVMDRSADLVHLLSTTAGKSDTKAMEAALQSLTQSVEEFSLRRRLTRYRDMRDLELLIKTLAQNIPPADVKLHASWKPPLDIDDEHDLLRFINSIVQEKGGGPLKDPKSVNDWWKATGQDGVLVATPGQQPGVRWEPKPVAGAKPKEGESD